MSQKIKWLHKPEKAVYSAAQSYLCLIYDEDTVESHIEKLKLAPISEFTAKDIFRASELPMVGATNADVKEDHLKIQSGQQLSPLLLLRDSRNGKVIIADGYHRLCAVFTYDDDASIPCKIA
jgi:hypothetical protein